MSFTLSQEQHILQKQHLPSYRFTAAEINTALAQCALDSFWTQEQTLDDMTEYLPQEDLRKRDTSLALTQVSVHVFRYSLLIRSRKYP